MLPPKPRFTRRELNYLRMIYIVVKVFPKILVRVFKREWRRWTSSVWHDNLQSGNEFWAMESSGSRFHNINQKIGNGDSSKFDSTILFYLILNSRSIGQNLRRYDKMLYSDVSKLRLLRNELVHRSNIEVPTRIFDAFFTQVCRCFKGLGVYTADLKAAKTMVCFDKKLQTLERMVEIEKQKLKRYEEYFTWRSSRFEEFSRRFQEQHISTSALRRKGILADQDVEKLERQRDEKLKNAMLVDCILHKGQTSTSQFMNILHQSNNTLLQSFTNTLPHETFTSVTIVSPELMQKASCKYPDNYRSIMFDFTRYIYTMDWDAMDQRGQELIEQSNEWSVKLFVMIELAYGHNVRGDSEKAITLLDEVTQCASRAGPNCTRILSRAYSRKSLHCIHVHLLQKAETYASEANTLICNSESPEEEIVGLKRITDCILYEDGSVEQRMKKSRPIYNKIIEMCHRYIDEIPRCLFYLRFIYHDMARLCLGFTQNGFVETTLEEIEEGEKYISRLEEPDLKTPSGDTYTDGFRFICKSVAAFKRATLAQSERQCRKLWDESLRNKQKATRICNSLKGDNNEAMYMLKSLNQYMERLTH